MSDALPIAHDEWGNLLPPGAAGYGALAAARAKRVSKASISPV